MLSVYGHWQTYSYRLNFRDVVFYQLTVGYEQIVCSITIEVWRGPHPCAPVHSRNISVTENTSRWTTSVCCTYREISSVSRKSASSSWARYQNIGGTVPAVHHIWKNTGIDSFGSYTLTASETIFDRKTWCPCRIETWLLSLTGGEHRNHCSDNVEIKYAINNDEQFEFL